MTTATTTRRVRRPKALRIDELHTQSLEVDDLRQLMGELTDTTLRLESTHTALHGEVARLQHELADANAALRRSQALAALGEMAAGIAHEVRNPLASIQLYAQMLGQDLDDRPQLRETCTKISRAVTGLDAIVRDVLSFARDMTIRTDSITAGELFDRALESCSPLLAGSSIQVEHVTGHTIRLSADAGLMTQALGNVIRNAIEAMHEASSEVKNLKLSAISQRMTCPDGKREQRIVLRIQDSGPGIAPEVLDRIVNPFFTTRQTGTGLGLAIVQRIVDAHGGHVMIRNDSPYGASIDLCMPDVPVARQSSTACTKTSTERRQRTESNSTNHCSHSLTANLRKLGGETRIPFGLELREGSD